MPETGEPDEETSLLNSGARRRSLLREPIAWLSQLAASFSNRLLVSILIGSHLLKGFVAGGGDEGLLGRPIEFFLSTKPYCLNALEIQVNKAIALSPWGLKPLIGMLSDRLPICGYHRKPYIVSTALLGTLACIVLGHTATESSWRKDLPLWGAVVCLFVCYMQVATVDLLLEARQSEEVKTAAKAPGADLVRYTWLGINLGQISGMVVAGYVLQQYGPRWCYVVAAPLMALVLVPALGNFLQERPSEVAACRVSRICEQNPELVTATIIVSAAVLVVVFVGIFAMDMWVLVPVTVICAVVVACTVALLIRPEVSKPTLYYFLMGVLSMRVDGALFYFFTDCKEHYAEGPHFSAWFFVAGLGLAFFSGCFVGTLTSELWSSWSYRSIAFTGGSFAILARLALLPQLTRHVRGPWQDPAYTFAVFFAEGLFESWCWIPRQVMNAMLTPMKLEASGLSLVSGTLNSARTLQTLLGAGLLCYLEVNPNGDVGDAVRMVNLPLAYGICCACSLLGLCLIPVLLPAGDQQTVLISDENESATHGSPWRRMRGR